MFKELSEKYVDYVQGAMAMTYRGLVQVDLGQTADAIDSFQRVLEQVDADGYDHIVSWQRHGRCFVIHKPKEFVEYVMPRYVFYVAFPSNSIDSSDFLCIIRLTKLHHHFIQILSPIEIDFVSTTA